MRSGNRRGVIVAIALASAAVMAPATTAQAGGGLWHTIPREVPAVDYRTGTIMMAPPIPYGEYAKDYVGSIHGAAGLAAGAVHGLIGKVCALCGGAACGSCGGSGHGHKGKTCGDCGGDGCGHCGGGLFSGHKHGRAADCVTCIGAGSGHGLFGHGPGKHGGGHGLFGHGTDGHGLSLCGGPGQAPCASPQGHVIASGQSPAGPVASHPCGRCGGLGLLGARACGQCGGHGLLGGLGGACKSCGGSGLLGGSPCGGCGGHGLLSRHKMTCSACGGHGKHHDGNPCHACGGTGLLHHLLGAAHGAAASMLGVGNIKYFVGPGGPVPLTPGYVPYVVPTRSPRDFFAFPPYRDRAMP